MEDAMTDIPLFVAEGDDAPKVELPFVEREAITALIFDPRTGRYLGLRWKQVDWETLLTGGVEEGQTPEEAARIETKEETGYRNLRLIKELPRYDAQFYHHPKKVNRFAHMHCFLFELLDDARDDVSADEQAKHDIVWLTAEEMKANFNLPPGHLFVLEQALAHAA